MSKLYGFKYTVKRCREYIEYIILSESDGRLYIDKYYNGTKHHFDITNKIDTFCCEIAELGIDSWNMNDYQSSVCWFPPADNCTFQINTDALSVAVLHEVKIIQLSCIDIQLQRESIWLNT